MNHEVITELKALMETRGLVTAKFVLMALLIEHMGMELDRSHDKATGRSEKRFNLAIRKRFPKRYHHFTEPQSLPNLFRDFRSPLVHRFQTAPNIILTDQSLPHPKGTAHLGYDDQGRLVLVAEDLFEDLMKALF